MHTSSRGVHMRGVRGCRGVLYIIYTSIRGVHMRSVQGIGACYILYIYSLNSIQGHTYIILNLQGSFNLYLTSPKISIKNMFLTKKKVILWSRCNMSDIVFRIDNLAIFFRYLIKGSIGIAPT